MAYENKVVLITGALGGMGQEIVHLLLDRKAKVALLDIHPDGGATFTNISKKYGSDNVLYIRADVSNPTQFEAAFQKTIDTFKHLDIVINNAGILNETDAHKIGSVNLTGTLIGTSLAFERFLPKHKSGDEGVVINMASLSGLILFPGAPLYNATKFGVVALGRSYGHEYHYNTTKVRILTLCPGFTETPMVNKDTIDTMVPARYGPLIKTILGQYPIQKVEEVGKMFLRAYEEGVTGSVWSICDGKGGEVEFPTFKLK